MAQFKNTQGITQIQFHQNIQCYCPLGKDFYTNKVTVVMKPSNIIPDYCEVEKFMRKLSGNSFVLEDVVEKVFSYLTNNYKPLYLKVSSNSDDAVHFEVTVTKETGCM